jgi:hypothetical protein
MPQPSCVRCPSDLKKKDEDSFYVPGDTAFLKTVQDDRFSTFDKHSKISSTKRRIIGSLDDAVKSLPSYIEMSWMMLVLVPTGEHFDRKLEIVDYCSWRRRGWCRYIFSMSHVCNFFFHRLVFYCTMPDTFVLGWSSWRPS